MAWLRGADISLRKSEPTAGRGEAREKIEKGALGPPKFQYIDSNPSFWYSLGTKGPVDFL